MILATRAVLEAAWPQGCTRAGLVLILVWCSSSSVWHAGHRPGGDGGDDCKSDSFPPCFYSSQVHTPAEPCLRARPAAKEPYWSARLAAHEPYETALMTATSARITASSAVAEARGGGRGQGLGVR